MTSKQENVLGMYYTVQELCNQHTDIWKSNRPFRTVFEQFQEKLPLIEQYRNTQIVNNTGIAQTKNQRREDLIEQAYFIANRLQSFALETKNTTLLSQINYTRTDFGRYRDMNLTGLCNTVLENAKLYLGDLKEYNVSEELIQALDKSIKNYTEYLAKPRASQTSVKIATTNLAQLFSETSELLKERLDRDIEVFYKSHPDFYNQYQNARRLIQVSINRLSLRIQVFEKDTQIPIPNVIIRINDQKEARKTTEKGNCQIRSLAKGNYQVSFEKVGYATQNVPVYIVDNETTELNVELEKE